MTHAKLEILVLKLAVVENFQVVGGDIGDSSKPAKTSDIAVIASAGETHV